eukprot:2016233-Rhodomonas_salina.2
MSTQASSTTARILLHQLQITSPERAETKECETQVYLHERMWISCILNVVISRTVSEKAQCWLSDWIQEPEPRQSMNMTRSRFELKSFGGMRKTRKSPLPDNNLLFLLPESEFALRVLHLEGGREGGREGDRQRHRHRHRQSDRATKRQRDRETERQRDRETERDRARQRETERRAGPRNSLDECETGRKCSTFFGSGFAPAGYRQTTKDDRLHHQF